MKVCCCLCVVVITVTTENKGLVKTFCRIVTERTSPIFCLQNHNLSITEENKILSYHSSKSSVNQLRNKMVISKVSVPANTLNSTIHFTAQSFNELHITKIYCTTLHCTALKWLNCSGGCWTGLLCIASGLKVWTWKLNIWQKGPPC